MTIDERTTEHEPLPTPEAARQEPQFDTRDTWQAYQREHYKWRTGLSTVNDADIPADEGEPPAPGFADIVLEVALGILGSGPGGQVGRVTTRPAASRPPLRPTSLRPTLTPKPPATAIKPSATSSGFKTSQKLASAIARLRNGARLRANGDLANQAIANRAPREPHAGATELSFLEGLLQQRANSNARGPGQLHSVAEIQALDFEVPQRVYRGHIGNTIESAAVNGLERAPGGNLQGDDYLAAIIMHTARQGGSNGEVLSLSAQRAIASKFAKGRGAPVFEIDTTQDPTAFRTINDILLADSQRLIEARKVTRATVLKAIDNIAVHREFEVFYVHGDIPAGFLVP
ncbi:MULTISPECIES: hypothetical protein [Pseudomonas]|uniref:hypothetical protein n=1 Tax=Pseudomonas TaxID=286 RepID=UPI00070365D9|nr:MULTISPECIES: hypothetical protein [Pseudomonas]KQQ59142.1 hypothetical protein ASF66_14520 [Pseudomonas sp. Leaf129]